MPSQPASSLSRRRPRAVAIVAFFIGAGFGFCFLSSSIAWAAVPIAAALCTAIWLATLLTGSRSVGFRWIGRAAWVIVLLLYVLWTYMALTFGYLLGWTVPLWVWPLVALVTVAAVATRASHPLHVPLALPLGIVIVAALAGWVREEEWLRCDDLLALQSPVELIVPSHPDLRSCQAGEVRPAGRFPRTTWEAPNGKRIIFTTQGEPIPGGLDGAVCEASLENGTPPHCVGRPINKSQGLIDWTAQKRLLVMQWGLITPNDVSGAVVIELPREEPIRVIAEHWIDQMVGEGFYEPRNSTLFMFSDKMDGIRRVILPEFAPAATIPITYFTPGDVRYDSEAGEGLACGNRLATAIRGEPFEARRLIGEDSSLVEKLAFSWGCAWDKETRKAYVAAANLGLLIKLDYDSGRVENRWFVGPGMRAVEYDPTRQRVYLTDFLRGDVVEFDERMERVTNRWFVGRYSRWVRLTRNGRALLSTSNLGILRIPLDED